MLCPQGRWFAIIADPDRVAASDFGPAVHNGPFFASWGLPGVSRLAANGSMCRFITSSRALSVPCILW